MNITLVTGPARSGKSEWAESLAEKVAIQDNQQLIYVATAQRNLDDAEWQARIDKHVQRRSPSWQCVEVPINLTEAIAQYDSSYCLLVDSLGTWLTNLIELTEKEWQMSQSELIAALKQTPATVVLVAEETGWGVVPAYKMGRTFRDRLGALSRHIGELATTVYLVTSGYAIDLTLLGQPIGDRSVNRPTDKIAP